MSLLFNETPDPAQPAGFWIRGFARAIDWIAQAGIGLGAGVFLGVFLGALAAATGGSPDALIAGLEKTMWINAIGSAVGALAYHIAYEGLTGTTIGKRMLGLQVLSESLQPITFVQAVRRSVGFLADALFFGAIGAMNMSDSPTKQRVGDRWAETRVVKRDSVPNEVRTSGILVFAGFIVAACVTGFIFALTQVLEGLWHLRGN